MLYIRDGQTAQIHHVIIRLVAIHLSRRGCTLKRDHIPWWRYQMETFSALLAFCAGNSPVPGEFPVQRTVTRSFDVFFDLCLNKRLSKHLWGWWFDTLSGPLWRHSNAAIVVSVDALEPSAKLNKSYSIFFRKITINIQRIPLLHDLP